jgi:transposase-like protein
LTEWTKRTQNDYTLAFKLAVVEQVERGELTTGQAQRRYGIQGSSTVLTWMRRHGSPRWRKASSMGKSVQKMSDPSKPVPPEQRIKELELQLKEAQQKADFFEAVVGVLKRDYGVQIGKKPVGKSSRKSSSKG